MEVWSPVITAAVISFQGALAPKTTTVRPTTSGEMPNLKASFDAARTRASAPATGATSPSANHSV